MTAPANPFLHEVAITAIIVKDGKYLLTRRPMAKKRYPGYWLVPGGRLEAKDYLALPKDTEHYWYNVLERTLRREIQEEVGLEIENIEYLTSLATVHADGAPSLVISCVADWAGGEVRLNLGDPEEPDAFAWVNLEESKGYKLMDGIYEELLMAERHRKNKADEKKPEWARA